MRIHLGARLFASFVTVALVGLGSAGYLVDRNVERAAYAQSAALLRTEVVMTGQMTASALFAPLARGDASLQGPVRELGAAVHTQLSLVAPDGALAADSEVEAVDPLASEADAAEVKQALAGGSGEAVRGVGAARRLWVAEAIRRDGRLLGVSRASIPTSTIEAQLREVRRRLAFGAGVALLIAMVSALLIAIGIVRPVRRLAIAARRLGQGELSVRANVSQDDEIGDLGRAIDEMAVGLQRMVSRLDDRNSDMRCVLDSVDQGLVTVDPKGAISEERSARVDLWFGSPPSGTLLWDLFSDLTPDARLSFEIGWSQLVDDLLPLETALDQLPTRITAAARTLQLRYIAIGDDPATRDVLVTITDVTQQVAAERSESFQRDLLRVIERTQSDRAGVVAFLREADGLVTRAVTGEASLPDARRDLHTLKGNCGLHGLQTIASLCHALETSFEENRGLGDAERELLHASWSEMRAAVQLVLGGREDGIAVSREQYREVLGAALAGSPPNVTASMLAEWSLTAVEPSLARLGAAASVLAAKLGKEVDVSVDGGGIRLDGERWEGFWSAFVHAVRNAVDHGLEVPEERRERGKGATGILRLRAVLAHDDFTVELEDDGRGIAWAAIAERLRARGHAAETTEDLVEGLFADGVSTAAEVTEVSGRGVGMSALRAAVRARGGAIEVRSTLNGGTTLRCVFPAACATVDPSWVLEREMARSASCRSGAPTRAARGSLRRAA